LDKLRALLVLSMLVLVLLPLPELLFPTHEQPQEKLRTLKTCSMLQRFTTKERPQPQEKVQTQQTLPMLPLALLLIP
jgi:hypothetical protein